MAETCLKVVRCPSCPCHVGQACG